MSAGAVIAGSAWRLGRPFADRLDGVIRDCVVEALGDAGLSIDEVDTVVTVAADTLDGISVPVRAEVAGGVGRRYLNVPSSAGHGFAAAATQIEAGEAETVVLVGWGCATRYAVHDPRANQADPFYARPIGASPRALAALQAHELSAAGGPARDTGALGAYAEAMSRRCWREGTGPAEGAPAWARTAFCDGAVAIVMRRGGGGVAVQDFASVSRGYCPDEESLDPSPWVTEALGLLRERPRGDAVVVEAAAPTPIAELRAIAVLDARIDAREPAGNGSGGGAAAHFGPATALRQVAAAAERLKAAGPGRHALVLDLAGPVGQHTTVMALRSGAAR